MTKCNRGCEAYQNRINIGVSWTPDYQMKDWYGRKQIIRVYESMIENRALNLVG